MSAATENILTCAIAGATMVGLYFAGAGASSFVALVILLNLNNRTQSSRQ